MVVTSVLFALATLVAWGQARPLRLVTDRPTGRQEGRAPRGGCPGALLLALLSLGYFQVTVSPRNFMYCAVRPSLEVSPSLYQAVSPSSWSR